MAPDAGKNQLHLWRKLVLGAVVLHLAAALFFIRYGALNPDEGFYAVASRAVAQGEVPYRDFGYTQTPLLPYVNGPLLQLAGSGLFEQRALNGLWGGLALGLAAWCVARRLNSGAALLLAVLFTVSSPWMYFIHLGKTYALAALISVIAAVLWLEWPAGAKKSATLGVLAVIGVGCRLPAAPFFAVLWLGSLWDGRRPTATEVAVAIAAPLLAFSALLLPFYLLAPENSWFWVLEFHRVSVPLKIWRLAWQEIATLAPALWLAALATATLLAARKISLSRREAILGSAALLALAANLLPSGVYEEYGVPFLLPLAMVVTVALGRSAWPRPALILGSLLVALVATPAILWRDFPNRRFTLSAWLTPNAPRLNFLLPAQLAQARAIVRSATAPDTPFIGPNLILALEAGRPVPPNLRMGPFSVSRTLPPEQAARLHLATPDEIERQLLDPRVSLLAFFPHAQLNYGWTLPTYERLPNETRARWLEIYQRDFPQVYQEGEFLLLTRPGAVTSASR